jgi:Ca2+:H+ antiporter
MVSILYRFQLFSSSVSSFLQPDSKFLFCELILPVYIAYLLFQLWSHSHLYDDQYDKKSSRLSSVIKEKNASRKERRISMARTESMQSDFSKAPDERPSLKERPTSFERTESQPEFEKMVNDPGMLYPPPRRPFLNPSPLSSSSELTLSIPTDTTAEKGVYFQTRPPTLRLASGSTVPMLRDSSNRYSGYSSESTVNFIPDEKLEERSPTVVDAPLFPIRKQPQLSWTLTVLLLVLVTAVSSSVMLGGHHADTCRSLNRL